MLESLFNDFWDMLESLFNDLWDMLESLFNDFWDMLESLFNDFWDMLGVCFGIPWGGFRIGLGMFGGKVPPRSKIKIPKSVREYLSCVGVLETIVFRIFPDRKYQIIENSILYYIFLYFPIYFPIFPIFP